MVDFSTKLVDLAGATIKDENGKDITLAIVCVNALTAIARGEENMQGVEKVKRAKLAETIYLANGQLKLTAEQTALLKELIGRLYTPLVVMRAWDLLDPS